MAAGKYTELSDLDIFRLQYKTDQYYETIEELRLPSPKKARKSVEKGRGTIAEKLNRIIWSEYAENPELISKEDPIIGEAMVWYSYDDDGCFRPVYVFEKNPVKSDGKYYEFVDFLTEKW